MTTITNTDQIGTKEINVTKYNLVLNFLNTNLDYAMTH